MQSFQCLIKGIPSTFVLLLNSQMLDMPSNLPEPQLLELISSMLMRIDCSTTSQDEVCSKLLLQKYGLFISQRD